MKEQREKEIIITKAATPGWVRQNEAAKPQTAAEDTQTVKYVETQRAKHDTAFAALIKEPKQKLAEIKRATPEQTAMHTLTTTGGHNHWCVDRRLAAAPN